MRAPWRKSGPGLVLQLGSATQNRNRERVATGLRYDIRKLVINHQPVATAPGSDFA